jgi:cbb3-type cytochrome oxidase subunit 3
MLDKLNDKEEVKSLLMRGGSILATYLMDKATEGFVDTKNDSKDDQEMIQAVGYAAFTAAFIGVIAIMDNRRQKEEEEARRKKAAAKAQSQAKATAGGSSSSSHTKATTARASVN